MLVEPLRSSSTPEKAGLDSAAADRLVSPATPRWNVRFARHRGLPCRARLSERAASHALSRSTYS
jgi:hypothetical protein